MLLKPGTRLRSTACSTEAIVVQAPADDVDLRCGGATMAPHGSEISAAELDSRFETGSQVGKRYVDGQDTLEILVTKPGKGGLSIGEQLLSEKAVKKLPSSD